MRRPRVTIGRLMTVVVFIAVNCGVLRAIWGTVGPIGWIVLGLMPMANLMAARLMIALKSGRVSPSWIGFGVFGSVAMAAYALLCLWNMDRIVDFLSYFLRPIEATAQGGGAWSMVAILIEFPLAWTILTLPQLGLALLGGWLGSRYRITIQRRTPAPGTADLPAPGTVG